MRDTRRYLIWSFTVVVLALGTVVMLDGYGRKSRVYGASGIMEAPQVEKRLVDSSLDAYRFWKERGVKGRTILFVADKWERLDSNDTQMDPPMSRPYPLQLYKIADLLERTRLTERNFLFVAAANGITRRIVAVLSPEGYDEMRASATASKNSRISANEIFQTHQGFPRWYTTGAGFKGENEPVLLYVSASYFRSSEPEELFRQLAAAGLRTDNVVLCRATGSESVTEREIAKLNRFARLIAMSDDVTATDHPTPAPISRP